MADADHSDSEAEQSLAAAEQAVAAAEARAEQARARAEALRRHADDDSPGADDSPERPDRLRRRWTRWVRRPSRAGVEYSAAGLLVAGLLAASAIMVWQHISLMHEQKRSAEYATAARHGVEMMLSIDPEHARENIQRVIDNTTGALQSQLRVSSTFLVDDAQKAKVVTKATVRDTAVESLTDRSAVVLVVAQSDTTNPDKSKRPSVFWRLSVGVDWDGGQPKISKLDFVQ